MTKTWADRGNARGQGMVLGLSPEQTGTAGFNFPAFAAKYEHGLLP